MLTRAAAAAVMLCSARWYAAQAAADMGKRAETFFPMSVWFGGGKARAPMLESNPLEKADPWRKDLAQIKKLGFNTVRCWIDWATGEPSEGVYNFQTLDVLLRLASEQGLKVIVQVYMDSARRR